MEFDLDGFDIDTAEYFSSTEPGSAASFESGFESSSFGRQSSLGNAASHHIGLPDTFQGYRGYRSPDFHPFHAAPSTESPPFTHLGQIYNEAALSTVNGPMLGSLNDQVLDDALHAWNERDADPMQLQRQMPMLDVQEPPTSTTFERNGPLVPQSLLSPLIKNEDEDGEAGMWVS